MRTNTLINIVSCHAGGEVGDVIVGGVAPPPGETLWEQRMFIARDGRLRDLVLNEPRGGVFRHVNLLVPPKHPDAAMGFIIMEPADTPPMSGSNTICVAAVLLETGLVPMQEPITEFVLEAPAGLVPIRAECREGKVVRVTLNNVPSFALALDARLPVPGVGDLTVDIAYGGDSFVIVDAAAMELQLTAPNARALAELGVKILASANAQFGFQHPERPDLTQLSFCLFATPPQGTDEALATTHACVVRPGKIDRSPTGTAVSARLAVLAARGDATPASTLTARSIIGSEFLGQIVGPARVGAHDAIIPAISGEAWITGTHQLMLDPTDPWPRGYRISDTWPNLL